MWRWTHSANTSTGTVMIDATEDFINRDDDNAAAGREIKCTQPTVAR
jgi:hypothetical protein